MKYKKKSLISKYSNFYKKPKRCLISNYKKLNYDILYLIFYLCDFNSLFVSRQVCNLWKKIIDNHLIWKEIYNQFNENIFKYKYKYKSHFSLVIKNIRNLCILCRKNHRIERYNHNLSESLLLSEQIFCRFQFNNFSINHDLICNECCNLLYNYFVKNSYNEFISYFFYDKYFKRYYNQVIKNGRTDLVYWDDVDDLSDDIEICL